MGSIDSNSESPQSEVNLALFVVLWNDSSMTVRASLSAVGGGDVALFYRKFYMVGTWLRAYLWEVYFSSCNKFTK